jgi:hypothetical protein
VRGGPAWTAGVWTCQPFLESLEGDQGCAVIELRQGEDARYVLVDGANAVAQPQLSIVPRPGGGAALMLVEARGLFHHADTWHAHLVEDDGTGPRLVLRVIIADCGGDERGFGCGVVRARARYADLDRDGDLDVEISPSVGGRRRFLRDGAGFVRPAGLDEVPEAPSFGFPDSGGPDESD